MKSLNQMTSLSTRIKAHPKQSFFIYNQEVYINTRNNLVGENANEFSVPKGYVSLI